MATAAPPHQQQKWGTSDGGSVVPVWLGTILQGVTILTIVGATYTLADRMGIETKLESLDRIEATLNNSNDGVSARLARLDERTQNIQTAVESMAKRSR